MEAVFILGMHQPCRRSGSRRLKTGAKAGAAGGSSTSPHQRNSTNQQAGLQQKQQET